MTKRKEKLPGDRFEFTAQWLEGVQAAVYREKIDVKTGKSVKRAEARDEYRDDQVPHLRLAVTEARKRHFVLYRRYKKGGAPRRDILGTYPALSLNGARDKARAWNTLADQGIDPREEEARIAAEAAAEKRRIARENSALVPFAKVAEDFIAQLENKRRVRDAAEIKRHVIPRLGDYPITKINSGHLILLGNAFKKQKATGRLLVSHAKRISAYAIHEFVEDDDGEPINKYGLDVDPFIGVKQKKLFGEKASRDRILTDDELAAAWSVLDTFDEPAAKALKLIGYTALRREEAGQLTWSEVDLKARTITLEGDRFKSGVRFIVPLSDDAVLLLRSIPRGKKGDYVFSARGADGAKHIDGWGPFFKKLRAELGSKAKTNWTAHDVRRTVRTAFSKLDVAPDVAELAIGHVKTGLIKTYDQWEKIDKRREAFDRWAELLHSIITPATSATIANISRARKRRAS